MREQDTQESERYVAASVGKIARRRTEEKRAEAFFLCE